MMKHRSIGMIIGMVSGILLVNQQLSIPAAVLIALGSIGLIGTILSWHADLRWRPWPSLAILLTAAAFTLPVGYWRTATVLDSTVSHSVSAYLHQFQQRTRIDVRGIICSEPELRNNRYLDLTVRVDAIKRSNEVGWHPIKQGQVRLSTYVYESNAPDVKHSFNTLALPEAYGYRIEARADYEPTEHRLNPADFDFGGFLLQQGIDASLRCHIARIAVQEESSGHPLMELALAAKQDFIDTFKRTIRAPASRVAAAATLGARRAVEHIDYRGVDITQMFRHAGVGHVLAVSGLHVSVIALLLFSLFRLSGIPPRVFVPPLIVLLVLFALLTGARPSSVRAVIMNSIILIAFTYFYCNIKTATLIGLSLSAVFILLINPMALFSPGFLLSYGAVLSLLLLTPPMDRFLSALRGASLACFIAWFAGVIALAIYRINGLVNGPHILALFVLLWGGIQAGRQLNNTYPKLLNIGMERMPRLLRLFLAAQLAIQIGMMIPMSAWFFGQFPIAGIFCNLIAIPAVGVLVQLGMLVGLIGLIPLAGPWLALPFGISATLVGEGFLLLAWGCARLFPFPAVPQPSMAWMLGYYSLIGIVLILEHHRHRLIDLAYLAHASAPIAFKYASTCLPLLLLIPLLITIPNRRNPPTAKQIDILASGNYPIIIASGDGVADLINAGNQHDGERLIFDSVRRCGAMRIRQAILPSPDADAGTEGVTALLNKMPIDTIQLAVLPLSTQSLTQAIDDSYLIDQAKRGKRWARRYDIAFAAMRKRANEHRTTQTALGTNSLSKWHNLSLRPLPPLPFKPTRFAASAITPPIRFTYHTLTGLIVTDTTPEAMRHHLTNMPACDVVIVPNLAHYKTYDHWLSMLLTKCHPRLLIIAGDEALMEEPIAKRLPPQCQLIQTGKDGAVKAILESNGTIHFETYLTKRTIDLGSNP